MAPKLRTPGVGPYQYQDPVILPISIIGERELPSILQNKNTPFPLYLQNHLDITLLLLSNIVWPIQHPYDTNCPILVTNGQLHLGGEAENRDKTNSSAL
ncbi:unnamed protein product [Rhizophagus irregularis]|nr:unnamed protein product [Rhizophagus irregularis]